MSKQIYGTSPRIPIFILYQRRNTKKINNTNAKILAYSITYFSQQPPLKCLPLVYLQRFHDLPGPLPFTMLKINSLFILSLIKYVIRFFGVNLIIKWLQIRKNHSTVLLCLGKLYSAIQYKWINVTVRHKELFSRLSQQVELTRDYFTMFYFMILSQVNIKLSTRSFSREKYSVFPL